MKFKIDDSITNRNVEYAIKYLFDSDNISHQAIIIYQLNKLINNKNIIFFMGNSGRKILNETLQEWDLDYEEKKSLTSNDSFILNIKKIKKKIS